MGLLEDAIREHLELKRRRGADAEEVAAEEKDALGPPGRPTPLEDAAASSAGVEARPEPAEEEDNGGFFDAQAQDAGQPAEEGLYEDAAADDIFPEDEPVAGHVEEAPATEHAVYEEPPAPEPAAYDIQSEEHDPDEVPVDDALEAAAPADVTPVPDPMPPPPEPAPPEPDPAPPPPPPAADAPTRIQPSPFSEPEPPPPPPTAAPEPEDAAADEGRADAEEGEEGDEGPSEDVLEETPEFLQETPEHDRLWFEQKPPRDFDFGG